eukprot:gb/GFBE01082861.1/.p1 GENE.gb/GFBE01082861.1/~~gb/GFBE01082861.1/.p1  ORF type:complete len:325 (+),score=67.21 gb/GFBE01082861.1/:1-975(+)
MARLACVAAALWAAAFHTCSGLRPDEESATALISDGSLLESSSSALELIRHSESQGKPLAETVQELADGVVNLSYLQFAGIYGTAGDTLPGVARCLGSIIDFGRLLLKKDSQGQKTPKAPEEEKDADLEIEMYKDALDKRGDLWRSVLVPLLGDKDETLTATSTNDDFYKTNLTSQLGGKLICKSDDITNRFIAIDEKLQLVLASIEEWHRDPKTFHLKTADTYFIQQRQKIYVTRKGGQVKAAFDEHKKTFVQRALDTLSSDKGTAAVNAVMLAKSILFYADTVYSNCDVVHRVSDLAKSISGWTPKCWNAPEALRKFEEKHS